MGMAAKILIDYVDAKRMSIDEAVQLAMEVTEETNSEVLFTYDPLSKALTSAIIKGDPFRGVPMPFVYFGEKGGVSNPKAVFHTHPKSDVKWDEMKKEAVVNETFGCEFSVSDFGTDFLYDRKEEMMLGCPATGEIITIRRDDIPKDDLISLIIKILENKAEGKAIDEGMNKINLISWEIKKKFPDLVDDVEKIRSKYFDDDSYFSEVTDRVKKDIDKIQADLKLTIKKHGTVGRFKKMVKK